MKKNYNAFTMAEVLITLGIIGIVAAMTFPVLIGKYQKTERSAKFKKSYSVLSQALNMSVAKDETLTNLSFSDNNNTVYEWYKYYLKPYIKIMKECNNKAGCWSKGAKTLNGNTPYTDSGAIGIGRNIVTIVNTDGVAINIDAYGKDSGWTYFGIKTSSEFVLVFFIDINAEKTPNIIGKDIFVYVFTPEGLVPAGRDQTQTVIDSNCSKNGTGYFCAAKVMQRNWTLGDENI